MRLNKNYNRLIENNELTIAVIGLGYVGLPLAVEFGKIFNTIGFDINSQRVNELNNKFDKTNEISTEELENSIFLSITDNEISLKGIDVFIITVPTPVDESKSPDLRFIESATKTVAKYIGQESIVVYESTVYPGCTEEFCVPILEKITGLIFNKEFYCGYSPERINPGDKKHSLRNIKKLVSGSKIEIANILESLYSRIINAGIFSASSIKVAEATKVIENAQRDINIAFVNELALVFDRMDIDTNEVLKAACTKWNFLDFKPGLVGGHCIGVDPYYLASKAQSLGYHPEMILAGRRINDSMGIFIAKKIIKLMIKKDIKVKNAKVLVLGITFKENCADIRNTRVIDLINEFVEFGCIVDVHDPHANKIEVNEEFGIKLVKKINSQNYNAVVLCVPHDEYIDLSIEKYIRDGVVIFDIKGIWSQHENIYSL